MNINGMNMKKILMAAMAAVAALAAPAVTKFQAAEAVWPAGEETRLNTRYVFEASFEAKAGEKPVLKLVAWYAYRVRLNGAFVAFGPARGPKGMFRPDEIALAAKAGKNVLTVEVAGYNVANYYLMKQHPFLKAEIVSGGRLLARSAVGGDFAAHADPAHIERTCRYSFQRTFAEAYRLPGRPAAPLRLAPAPEPVLIERRAPYPDYEFNPAMDAVSFAKAVYDPAAKVRSDRALTLPGTGKCGDFGGFPMDTLAINASHLVQRIRNEARRPATEVERAAKTFPLKAGGSWVFDNGLNDAGFPGLKVTVSKPGRLVLQFDEILSKKGDVLGHRRCLSFVNAVVWDFDRPGVYEVETFEPYVMRYVDVTALSGEMEISAPRFRSYKNATAKRASFASSDPALVRIFDAASETFRQNAVDVFMDCPSRERAGWNCDAYFSSPIATLLTGDSALERVFEENIALPKAFDNQPEGMIPMCYPSDHIDGNFIPNWAFWFVLETEQYLARSGDRETIDRLKPRFEALVKYLWTFRNSDGLLEHLPKWVFIEWSRANRLVQDVNYPSNMTWAEVLDAMNRLYGRADLAAEAARVRETIRRQSWTGHWFCDNAVRGKDGKLKLSGECTETCQYYAFFFGTATPSSHPELWKTLVDKFGPKRLDANRKPKAFKEIAPSNAIVGNYLRLILFERLGMGERILDECRDYFDYMAVRTGTLWENDTDVASCNHGFASYVAKLIVSGVMGVEIDRVGKTVTLRDTDAAVSYCSVRLPSGSGKRGEIWVERRLEGGRVTSTARTPSDWKVVRK